MLWYLNIYKVEYPGKRRFFNHSAMICYQTVKYSSSFSMIKTRNLLEWAIVSWHICIDVAIIFAMVYANQECD